ncbi:energy-coupling factor transporter transmembrane component T family protein [Kyrpidia tusciae]|uniref:Cobalt transport protein n=1 Tax=Kyrpidia tusciae (strain DSM 2912 / NBRC 15312 / T2) TaxID=562970 RepID=D5WWA8_KYRT2|nr:energy-coupling factor transporter transmembrane component T [Kyrpidia tusciae]ADG07673.1 cobalt transport protein [Kyrpidia tusciae DSM 2912]
MSSFELTRYVTIGQYIPADSAVHRLDPRVKIILFAMLVLTAAFASTYTGNVVMAAACLLVLIVSRVPVGYGLSGLRPALPFVVVLFILQVLFLGKGPGAVVLWQAGWFSVTADGLKIAVVAVMRFLEILCLVSVLTLTTTVNDLARGTEALLRPLARIRFPVHEVTLILTITVRFVPTFAMEMEKLVKAQASRGADFGHFRWWQVVRRTKQTFPVIIPLFVSAMHRAEDLITAMEARGYVPGARRTTYTEYRMQARDGVAAVLVVAFCAAMWLIRFPV